MSLTPAHVAVIGAGFAGLSAAYHLARLGYRVTVLERQARLGGRALTITSPLAPGLIAETGPARFPPEFGRVLGLARRFGLEVEPFYPEWGTVVSVSRGTRLDAYEPSPEEFWGYAAIRKRYPTLAERMAVRTGLQVRAVLRRLRGRLPWRTYRIGGGAHRLAEALAAHTDADFRLDATVAAIRQSSLGVAIDVSSGGRAETVHADYAVCAVPLSVLRDIRFEPVLAAPRQRLAADIPFTAALRVYLQMRRPYWRDLGHNGFAVTDTVGEVWDPNFDAPREPALLVCYAKQELAERICRLSESERLEYVLEHLELVFPGAHEHFEHGFSFCWRSQPWIRGGWPLVRPFSRQVGVFREAEGRVHFAGDYAASPDWLNTGEGAIESGERAARAIASAA